MKQYTKPLNTPIVKEDLQSGNEHKGDAHSFSFKKLNKAWW